MFYTYVDTVRQEKLEDLAVLYRTQKEDTRKKLEVAEVRMLRSMCGETKV
jgi:hypothetical protein